MTEEKRKRSRILRADDNLPKLYQYNLLSKVMPSDKRTWTSFKLFSHDDNTALYIAELLEELAPGGPSALANRASLGVKSIIRYPTELDYELPAGYIPTNMKWVGVRARVFDYEGGNISRVLADRFFTIPGVYDVDVLREALQEIRDAGYLLLYCDDGIYRDADEIRIEKIDEYKV